MGLFLPGSCHPAAAVSLPPWGGRGGGGVPPAAGKVSALRATGYRIR